MKVSKRFEKLMPIFMDHQNKNIENLDKFFALRKFHEIARLGHIIKGLAGGYGFDELIEIGNELELAAQVQDLEKTKLGIERYRNFIGSIKFEFVAD